MRSLLATGLASIFALACPGDPPSPAPEGGAVSPDAAQAEPEPEPAKAADAQTKAAPTDEPEATPEAPPAPSRSPIGSASAGECPESWDCADAARWFTPASGRENGLTREAEFAVRDENPEHLRALVEGLRETGKEERSGGCVGEGRLTVLSFPLEVDGPFTELTWICERPGPEGEPQALCLGYATRDTLARFEPSFEAACASLAARD